MINDRYFVFSNKTALNRVTSSKYSWSEFWYLEQIRRRFIGVFPEVTTIIPVIFPWAVMGHVFFLRNKGVCPNQNIARRSCHVDKTNVPQIGMPLN
jgi:hypothetical protein